MWSSQLKNGTSVLRTAVRFTRSYAPLKSEYDALVVGGGGFCSGFATTAYVENFTINFFAFLRVTFLCNLSEYCTVHKSSNRLNFYKQ